MSLKEDINFSLWCDFIERDFLENKFQDIVKNQFIYGATSNPAIFKLAITNSVAYKETIEEAMRLNTSIGADNVMIKIPATKAGYEAMRELTSGGIHVNATLVFSPKQAIKCAKALDEGIKISNKDVKGVVSVFVSRFDRMCDNELVAKGLPPGKLGIVNATKCYHEVQKLQNKNIRTLFASTSVKGDDLNASYYVDNLIYENSINTAPLATIEDWVENGIKIPSEIITEDECDEYFNQLKDLKVDIKGVYEKLLNEGIGAFKTSFKDLLSKLQKNKIKG